MKDFAVVSDKDNHVIVGIDYLRIHLTRNQAIDLMQALFNEILTMKDEESA